MIHPQLVPTAGIVQLDVDPTPPPRPLLKTSTGELADLAVEFAAFTTGLLHTRGHLRVDPIAEFVQGHSDRSCDVSVRDFERILFSGIARDASEEYWDRRLFFVERRFWDELRAFIGGVAIMDSTLRLYAETRPDLVAMPVTPGKPGTFVTVFGVSGNTRNWRMTTTAAVRPTVVRRPLEADVVARAEAVFARGAAAWAGRPL